MVSLIWTSFIFKRYPNKTFHPVLFFSLMCLFTVFTEDMREEKMPWETADEDVEDRHHRWYFIKCIPHCTRITLPISKCGVCSKEYEEAEQAVLEEKTGRKKADLRLSSLKSTPLSISMLNDHTVVSGHMDLVKAVVTKMRNVANESTK